MNSLLYNMIGGTRKDAASYHAPTTRDPHPCESHTIRLIMRRAWIGLSHALLVAELAGILREGTHYD
jgi:hypothetical protein